MISKVTQSSKNITALGGLNFIYQAMNQSGLEEFINKTIGSRSIYAQYSYADIVYSLFGNCLSQGSFVSDLEVFKEKYSHQVFNRIPSPDTVEYACQELKTPNIVKEEASGVIHQLNYNTKMNEALIKFGIQTQQLTTECDDYILDYDNVIIENDKQDAAKTYKHTKGYHPGIAFIGRIAVHIENHNGNTPARFEQAQTLERCFDNLDKNNIRIKHFRADAASYQKDVIELVTRKAQNFYIRMMNFDNIRKHFSRIKNWKSVVINHEKKEVASIWYAPFNGEKKYRIVVTRTKNKNLQIDLLTGSGYTYQGIITNNEVMTEEEVIGFYNQRGDAENSNRYMLNDFNLHNLPFMDMDTNTVYMYFMAMCATLFEWVKCVLVKNKIKSITLAMRVKAVCFNYIAVATTFVKHARETILKVFSTQTYSILRV